MLLEKNLPFESISLQLNGDQFSQDFTTINPFHHVPVLIDRDIKLVESLAILDYLDSKYPEPSLIPKDATKLAQVRMVQFLAVNELMPSLLLHIYAESTAPQLLQSKQQLALTLTFLSELLGSSDYFGGEMLSVADIVAGTVMPLLQRCGVTLSLYGRLQQWCDRIIARPTWQETDISDEGWYEFQRRIQVMAKLRYHNQSKTPLKPTLAKLQRDDITSA